MAADPPRKCHVVAMSYPGRGHINPMMNLCKLIVSKRPDIFVTFIVTEEWLGFLGTENKPANIRFGTVPNVIPSELDRGSDFAGFYEATQTKLEAPVERLLDGLEPPTPSVIIYDTYLAWVVGLGNRRNIPVATLWTMPATVFTMFYHSDVLAQTWNFPVNVSDQGQELVNCIPGISSLRIADLPTPFHGKGQKLLPRILETISLVPKAQYLLFTSIYELEYQVIDALKSKFPIPIYSIGPAIPYFNENFSPKPDYIKWLDAQPKGSVLYISQGSFLSVSSTQLDEIVAGVQTSGVRYFWVARAEASRFREGDSGGGSRGLVVPWCDQLKVLCHSSIGGFWSHCGWNSIKECVFAGLPMLTFPIFWDQIPNSKMIVEDWKIGWRVKGDWGAEIMMKREEIAGLVRRFMDLESDEGKEIRRRAKEVQEICGRAVAKGGSSDTNIDAFIKDIS